MNALILGLYQFIFQCLTFIYYYLIWFDLFDRYSVHKSTEIISHPWLDVKRHNPKLEFN